MSAAAAVETVDYPASSLFRRGSAQVRPEGEAPPSARRGRAPDRGMPAAVFDLGAGAPVPSLKKPFTARQLLAMQNIDEIAQRMANEAMLIETLIRDNDLPLVPRGIGTARYACGDLLHNLDAAMAAHAGVMERG